MSCLQLWIRHLIQLPPLLPTLAVPCCPAPQALPQADRRHASRIVAALLAEARQRLPDFEPRATAFTLRALAKLGVRHRPTLQLLAEHYYEHMLDYPPAELSLGLWALAKLRYEPRTAFVERFCFASRKAMPHMDGKTAGLMMLAVSQLHLVPNAKWLSQFCTHAEPLLRSMPPQVGAPPPSFHTILSGGLL